MPTRNRRAFVPQAIAYFQRQDYANRELIILDDGEDPVADLVPPDERIVYRRLDRRLSLGEKRNLTCEASSGSILIHWDDDDWYAPWRVRHQVERLLQSGRGLSGSPDVLFYAPGRKQAWLYEFPGTPGRWLAGATLCYMRSLWENHPFASIDIGEDAVFVERAAQYGTHIFEDPFACVGIIHDANAAPKIVSDRGWQPYPLAQLMEILGPDQGFYASLPAAPEPLPVRTPLVSAITPTFNRRAFVARSIKYFLAQDYPAKEMIIVDDGSDPVGDLARVDPQIRYIRAAGRLSIGAKRNQACAAAAGEIIVQWDDDDWYGPSRLSHQVADIAAGRADVTGLGHGLLFDMRTRAFWAAREELHNQMFFQSHSIHGGTLAYSKSTWQRCGGYPDESLAEDAAFLSRAIGIGARLTPLKNGGTFVYVRHNMNSWRFDVGGLGGSDAWQRVEPPPFFPKADLSFYTAVVAGDKGTANV
jgi:glycosyltransferase involved in cell wall biosynthesis